jgi:hypothetical protein
MSTSIKYSTLIYSFLCFSLVSCNRFYKPIAVQKNTQSKTLREAIKTNKFLILRDSSGAYSMQDVQMNEASDTLYARLTSLDKTHTLYVTDFARKHVYKPRKGQSKVLDEVHVFSDENLSKGSLGHITMSMTDVRFVETIVFDRKRTSRRTLRYALGAGAIVASVILMAAPAVEAMVAPF